MTQPSDGATQPPGGEPGQTPSEPFTPPGPTEPVPQPLDAVTAQIPRVPPAGEPQPSAPGQPQPATSPVHPYPGQPGSAYPGQPYPGQPGSAYPGQPYPGQPVSAQPYPGFGHVPPPGGPGGPPAFPPPPPPGFPARAPRSRRGLLIASLVLAVVLLLCAVGGVGAFLVLRRAQSGEGAAEPVAAVDNFLRAVYQDRDAEKAASVVCSEARDQAEIAKKVDEVKGYARTYKSPRFRWEPPKVDEQNAERAIVSAKLTMITGDEKTSQQSLRFTVVQKTGWWICEVG